MRMIIKRTTGFLLMATMLFSLATAQERNDVITAYNEGAKLTKTDPAGAIASFEKAVELADKVGESAADLKGNAVKVLPGLYFRVALNALNEKKPATEVILLARRAAKVAAKYNNTANNANIEKVLAQAYSSKGGEFFTKNDYPNALATFDSVLAINPGSLTAINNKALIYVRQDNAVAFEETIDSYIEKLTAANDTVRLKQAGTMAIEYFRSTGSKALQANKTDEALAALTKASKYGVDKDVYYFYADLYNRQKAFDKAGENALKGLALEKGDAAAKAKFYYQLASAQAGAGKTAEACASFKNALYGAFAEPSKAQRTALKCTD